MSQKDLNRKWQDLLFGVRRSIRYHDRRVRFFERMNRIILFVNVASGSAAVVSVLSSLGGAWVASFAAIVALASAFDLAVDTGSRARTHTGLKHLFVDLEKSMNTSQPSQAALIDLTNMRLDIERDEPPVLRVLDILCHNEMVRALGYSNDHLHPVTWWRRMLAHIA